jgi:hypothetical protein
MEQQIMSTEILTPVGRLVSGHPMEQNAKTDNQKQPKFFADGQPMMETYVGVAIPKTGEADWKHTPWGQQLVAEATAAWPRGEHGAPSFAWKIIDGDSAVPNKKGTPPNSREGFPGHWVIGGSTMLHVKCFHAGMYEAHQVIQNKGEIKRGDYCRLLIETKGNGSTDSPGMYVNPTLFELTRAGIEIIPVGNGPSAAEAFGGSVGQLPQGALIDTAVAQPAVAQPAAATPPVVPAHDLVQPGMVTPPPAVPPVATPPPVAPVDPQYSYNGVTYAKSALLAMPGWSEAIIEANCTLVG